MSKAKAFGSSGCWETLGLWKTGSLVVFDLKGASVTAYHKARLLVTGAGSKASVWADAAYGEAAKVADVPYKYARRPACFPFEHPSAGTLLYGFLAGIAASLGAQLLLTVTLSPEHRVSTSTLITSGLLFFFSSGLMVRIAFELEAYRQDLINAGPLRAGSPKILQTLEMCGAKQPPVKGLLRPVNRVWGLWIVLADSLLSALCAMLLLWPN